MNRTKKSETTSPSRKVGRNTAAGRKAKKAPARRPRSSQESNRRLHILITAGPTREYFDSVRYISNPSTGKMGYAIAAAAVRRGHRVTLVSGPVALDDPPGVKTIRVETGDEMYRASRAAFRQADAAIFTAAVCDYRPLNRAARKRPKARGVTTVRLAPTVDIAAALGRTKGRRLTLAFALEDHNGRAHAEGKMLRKNSDAIILNGPANVGSDRATVEFLARGCAWQRWPQATKQATAARIVAQVERLLG